MTPAQKRALDFIRVSIEKNGYSPSYQEIADALRLRSKAGAHRLVHGLASAGEIHFRRDRKRSIQLGGDNLLRLAELVLFNPSRAYSIAREIVAGDTTSLGVTP